MIKPHNKDLLLAIDIGNTAIDIGLFKNRHLSRKVKIRSSSREAAIFKGIKKLGSLNDLRKAAVIISSVAPLSLKHVKGVLGKKLGVKPFVLGRHLRVPIKNLYKKPLQVGQDRLVAAYACHQLYKSPAIIVDFGTAVTFDLVNRKGEYEGGLITIGADMAAEALADKTALLPKIRLKSPKRLIGKDTKESIRSGIVFGMACMCKGLVDRIKNEKNKQLFVLATGGLSRIIAKHSKCIDKIDDNLILKGLCLIYYNDTNYK
ncbi:MAG: type III pantothenate kinase [Candidatus Omnitrophica bacterium]|nr:type III pantothenate kinase [Candidatus Omnitrophota bacterium]